MAIAIVGCQPNSNDVNNLSNANSIVENQSEQKKFLITNDSVGDAEIGMNYGELKEVLGDEYTTEVIPSLMVDINAIAISKQGEVLYYLLFPVGVEFDDLTPIQVIMTDNPRYGTKEGVSVGSSIKDAETAYGGATFSYNTNNESREYVEFANSPSNKIRFRSNSEKNGFAGIYGDDIQEYNQTNVYQDDAKISLIEVYP